LTRPFKDAALKSFSLHPFARDHSERNADELTHLPTQVTRLFSSSSDSHRFSLYARCHGPLSGHRPYYAATSPMHAPIYSFRSICTAVSAYFQAVHPIRLKATALIRPWRGRRHRSLSANFDWTRTLALRVIDGSSRSLGITVPHFAQALKLWELLH